MVKIYVCIYVYWHCRHIDQKQAQKTAGLILFEFAQNLYLHQKKCTINDFENMYFRKKVKGSFLLGFDCLWVHTLKIKVSGAKYHITGFYEKIEIRSGAEALDIVREEGNTLSPVYFELLNNVYRLVSSFSPI